MSFTNDETFYNYIALWRAIVYQEGQKNALRMCGIKLYEYKDKQEVPKKIEKTKKPRINKTKKEFKRTGRSIKKIKRTDVNTGEEVIFDSVTEAIREMGVTAPQTIREYIYRQRVIKGYMWEYVEEEDEQNIKAQG